MASALMTDPLWRKGRKLDEVQARILYGMATKLDGLPGEFPPDDTGSSGLGAAKAAKALGYISAYHHAFGLDHALAALPSGRSSSGSNGSKGATSPIRTAWSATRDGAGVDMRSRRTGWTSSGSSSSS